ncbi:FliM/FliN family flagellar motor switch protein [Parvularcula lutaonensis]|uniref:Flagellar motor switch protein FliN n=1 Tax=Parvularcula lutaonensis TaxID=491923 RepID=A0ABV7MD27_9PROT|nr:FliM/FliN family flagellar motor switch protein [Parvularcula lutaonensis]GGY51577.1 hypothetical protein GCM10007148_20610 [Parvularcula lutaonensis]
MTAEPNPAPETPALPENISSLKIELSVRVGTSVMSLRDLTSLSEGAVVALRESADRPLELCANGHVIARGELEEAENGEGLRLRITETKGFPRQ